LIQADASDRTRVEGAVGLPSGAAGHAVEEYLAVLDDAAFGAASEVTPKFIAPADPATRWTAAHRGPALATAPRRLPLAFTGTCSPTRTIARPKSLNRHAPE